MRQTVSPGGLEGPGQSKYHGSDLGTQTELRNEIQSSENKILGKLLNLLPKPVSCKTLMKRNLTILWKAYLSHDLKKYI